MFSKKIFLVLLAVLAFSISSTAFGASVTVSEPQSSGFLVTGSSISLPVEFSGVANGVNYTAKSVTDSSGTAINFKFSDSVLTLTNSEKMSKTTDTYTAVFGADTAEDIQATFKLYTTDASSYVANNAAGLEILTTPVGAVSSIDAELKANNLVNAIDYTTSSENSSASYSSGASNEIKDSGFSLSVKLSNVPENKFAIIGFSKAAYLNAETLGSSEAYEKISEILKKQPTAEEGGVTFYLLDSAAFKEMGISVRSSNPDRDLTDSVGAGAIFAENSIALIYGAMLADSSTIEEGTYTLSPEGENLLNDGANDDEIKASWYLTLSDGIVGGSGGGCNVMNFSGAALLFAAILKIIRS
ncbi:MAG: hypothetical protein IJ859_06535 [Synergistaceae bacterium]|nr:hypothetical protein [Synergistaceae bacterium]